MFRYFAITLWATFGLFVSLPTYSLSFSELSLRSALYQPLDAQIGLKNIGPLVEGEIQVSLADEEEFLRAGIDRTQLLLSLRFNVIVPKHGEPYIQVFTVKPIVEPYLNFILRMQSPKGLLLREYTIFLDMPAL